MHMCVRFRTFAPENPPINAMSYHRAEKSTIDVVVVIAYLLKKAASINRGLTPLQINKLVYICHGWTLGLLKKPLIENRTDQIQAWKYGPVVTEAYETLKRWGSQVVTYDSFCDSLDLIGIGKKAIQTILEKDIDQILDEKPKMCEVIDMVWYVYQDRTGGQLITLTHKDETPWTQHVKKNFFGQVVHGVHIPDSSISSHYEEKIRRLISSSDD